MPLLTKTGSAEIVPAHFINVDDWDRLNPVALDVPNDASAEPLVDHFAKIDSIRILFPDFADGRGFTLAQTLRHLGYEGRLRASGHIIYDQFDAALDVGFDEIEIDDELYSRLGAESWFYGSRPSYRDKLAARVKSEDYAFPVPEGVFSETVTEVEHYTDGLFRFRITRPDSFRFRSGEFAMIGLNNAENPVYRAYSIASSCWEETLEFYSIKVPNGPLTEKLQHIKPGDKILLKSKATGTLVHDVLLPGRRLWLLSTGTGIAPFASLVRDPDTYSRFESVYLIHTGRYESELKYGFQVVESTCNDPLVGDSAQKQLTHYASTTREQSKHSGRVTTLFKNGKLFEDLGVNEFDKSSDRVMICGSIDMLAELKTYFEEAGFSAGTNRKPGEFAIERAFVG